jgi:hypothetical protein
MIVEHLLELVAGHLPPIMPSRSFLIAERRDSIQRADLAVGDKMNMGVDEAWKHRRRLMLGEITCFVDHDRGVPSLIPQ